MKKKTVFFLTFLFLFSTPAFAFSQDTYVNGYYNSSGTYVQPYHRSAPDGNPYNNYSTQGNINPYTGSQGTHSPNIYNNPSPSYTTPQHDSFTPPMEPLGGNGRPGSLY